MVWLERREFITLLGGAVVARPLAARAQQPAMPVVGLLRDSTAAGSEFMVNGLRKGLVEAGFVEGQNLAIEYRWADDRSERLPALAADLVGRSVAVILAAGNAAAVATKGVTTSMPTVFFRQRRPDHAGTCHRTQSAGWERDGLHLTGKRVGAETVGPAARGGAKS